MTDTAPKSDQAKLLVALQDLDQMIQEAQDADESAKLKEMGFPLDGLEKLQAARDKITEQLKPQLLNRYSRVAGRHDRTVVPVAGELCTGCFANVPTSFRYEKNAIMTCENCGRILYFI